MSEKSEIVYVLANEAMPNLIKIGKTKRKDLQARMSELYTTGVPFPFECLWAGEVKDCNHIEKIIHNAFVDKRVNLKREFFNVRPEQVIPLLQVIAEKEITSDVNNALVKDISEEEQNAAKKLRRSKMNFEEMGIPDGAVLVFVKNKEIRVYVNGIDKVLYNNQETSLTPLTRELLNLSYNVQPSRYWTYEDKALRDIYEDTYTSIE